MNFLKAQNTLVVALQMCCEYIFVQIFQLLKNISI